MYSLLVLIIFTIFVPNPSTCQPTEEDYRRPFYNIGHMANSIPEVDEFLRRGANAIEADISFTRNGEARWVFHGHPCDCFRMCRMREDFGKYLEHIRDLSTPGSPIFKPELVLLFLDLKVSKLPQGAKFAAGQSLATKLTRHLWDGRNESLFNIYVLMSIGHTHDTDVVKGVRNTLVQIFPGQSLQRQIGWDIGLNDKLGDIDKAWELLGVDSNVWLGDGITNCLSYLSDNSRLQNAVEERERNSRFGKVYRWTVDFSFSLKYTLRLGVDGIITNHPERLKDLIRDPEFIGKFRPATKADNPWRTTPVRTKSDKKNKPTLEAVVSTVNEAVGSFWRYFKDGTGL